MGFDYGIVVGVTIIVCLLAAIIYATKRWGRRDDRLESADLQITGPGAQVVLGAVKAVLANVKPDDQLGKVYFASIAASYAGIMGLLEDDERSRSLWGWGSSDLSAKTGIPSAQLAILTPEQTEQVFKVHGITEHVQKAMKLIEVWASTISFHLLISLTIDQSDRQEMVNGVAEAMAVLCFNPNVREAQRELMTYAETVVRPQEWSSPTYFYLRCLKALGKDYGLASLSGSLDHADFADAGIDADELLDRSADWLQWQMKWRMDLLFCIKVAKENYVTRIWELEGAPRGPHS